MSLKTRTFKNIEFTRVGTWDSRNGPITITKEDLLDAVKAYADPEIDHGRLKFGHVSSLNDGLGDGAPSIGWLENVKLSDDGERLLGDIVDVPQKVADLIGVAYRSQSVEMRRNVKTPSGKTYRTALTGLALLGASNPAAKGLKDLKEWPDIVDLYASESPDGIDDDSTESEIVSFELSAPIIFNETDQKEKPTMAFLDEARIALSLSEGASEEEILEALKSKTATEETPTEEETPVTEEVTEETTEEEAPVEQETTEETVEASPEASEPKVVKVSESVYNDEQAELAQLRAEKAERQRKETIDQALSEGKITPAERPRWEVALASAPEATTTLLSELPVRVNVSELGSDVALSATPESDNDDFDPHAYWVAQGISN